MSPKLEAVLAVMAPLIALAVMGTLAILLVFFPVPGPNEKYLIFILGALAGVVTTVSVQKALTPPPAPPAS